MAHSRPRELGLRTAFGPGLVTLDDQTLQAAHELRTAFGPGLVTLHNVSEPQENMLRTAFGPGLVTLLSRHGQR